VGGGGTALGGAHVELITGCGNAGWREGDAVDDGTSPQAAPPHTHSTQAYGQPNVLHWGPVLSQHTALLTLSCLMPTPSPTACSRTSASSAALRASRAATSASRRSRTSLLVKAPKVLRGAGGGGKRGVWWGGGHGVCRGVMADRREGRGVAAMRAPQGGRGGQAAAARRAALRLPRLQGGWVMCLEGGRMHTAPHPHPLAPHPHPLAAHPHPLAAHPHPLAAHPHPLTC